MTIIEVVVDDDLAALLSESSSPLPEAARELMVLELYRRGAISSGKAAECLRMDKLAFIRHASELGIPYFNLTAEEWEAERRFIDQP
ncbi:MAG: UPF0175 family protein [Candidatus Sumerlaeota bacterium]|nr:UPF0175 family protein [Candidatus Sumerlaeota bacterium]